MALEPCSVEVPTGHGHWGGEEQNDKTGCSHKGPFDKKDRDMGMTLI